MNSVYTLYHVHKFTAMNNNHEAKNNKREITAK